MALIYDLLHLTSRRQTLLYLFLDGIHLKGKDLKFNFLLLE